MTHPLRRDLRIDLRHHDRPFSTVNPGTANRSLSVENIDRVLRNWRKLSFGTHTAKGSRFAETILTVVETCHRQSLNTFEYLTTARQAHFSDHPTPSLLSSV